MFNIKMSAEKNVNIDTLIYWNFYLFIYSFWKGANIKIWDHLKFILIKFGSYNHSLTISFWHRENIN